VKMARGKCGRKRSYLSESDAFIAASTQLKKRFKEDDWVSFRAYLCEKCRMWHLTKQGERR